MVGRTGLKLQVLLCVPSRVHLVISAHPMQTRHAGLSIFHNPWCSLSKIHSENPIFVDNARSSAKTREIMASIQYWPGEKACQFHIFTITNCFCNSNCIPERNCYTRDSIHNNKIAVFPLTIIIDVILTPLSSKLPSSPFSMIDSW